jgi:carotenoid cleavage dioxygenase-like enzyme
MFVRPDNHPSIPAPTSSITPADTRPAPTPAPAQRIPAALMRASAAEIDDVRLDVLESVLPEGLPRDLGGHLFFVGPSGSVEHPGLPSPGGVPVFNGNGKIYRVDFDGQGEARATSRIAKTACFFADEAAARDPRFAGQRFHDLGLMRASARLGLRNQLNTALVPIHAPGHTPRLLVTYDAGRPHEIDTESLRVVTPVGHSREWRPALPIDFPFPWVLSTAHPVHDARTGELWTVNFAPSLLGAALRPLGPKWTTTRDAAGVSMRGRLAAQAARTIDRHAPALSGFTYLCRWDGEGEIERFRLVLEDGTPVEIRQSIHQMAITREHVVLVDTAFKVGLESLFDDPVPEKPWLGRAMRRLLTRPQVPFSAIYLVKKSALGRGERPLRGDAEVRAVAKRIVVPLELVHFLVDDDDAGGLLTLHAAHNPGADVAEWVHARDVQAGDGQPSRALLRGMSALGQTDVNRLGRYTIDTRSAELVESRVIAHEEHTIGIGLYAHREATASGLPPDRIESIYWQGWGVWSELATEFVDDLYADHPYRQMPLDRMRQIRAEGGRPASLLRLDTRTMSIADRYELPRKTVGDFMGTPYFVPRRGGSSRATDGYLVCAAATIRGSELWLFDAARLSRGPLCKLHHPNLSFGWALHGAWLPTIGRRTASYEVPIRADLGPSIAQSPPAIRALFEQAVFPQVEAQAAGPSPTAEA